MLQLTDPSKHNNFVTTKKGGSSLSQQKGNKTSPVVVVSVFVLLILLVLYQLGGPNQGNFFSGGTVQAAFTPTGVSLSYDYDSQPYFYSNGRDSFFFTTKDGISYITADGHIKWNHVYNFTKPTVKTAKDIVAVSEIGGRSVHVFGISGRLYGKDFDYPVLYFSVNRIGYLIVQLKKDSDYETKIFDEKGELIFEYKHQDYNTYPITSDISIDGRISALNLLEVGGLQMVSSLSCTYTFGSARSAFAARNKENQLISVTKFIDGNNLITVSDTEISAYSAGEENYFKDITTLPLNNKLSYFGFIGERGFAAVLGQGVLNKPSEPENTIKLFNSSATEIGQFQLNKPATYFHAGNDAIIVGSYSTFFAISDRGALLWEYVAPGDIKQMIFLGNTNTILVASGNEASVFKRSRNAPPPPAMEVE